jgi:gamma-D-glutamyl-L-lysine dipeptidyl-peptidase
MPAQLALVRTPIAPMQKEARVSSPQVSQTLFGHALLVLATDGDWCHVRGMLDGYEGWTHRGYLSPIDVPEVDDPDVVPPYEARTFAVREESEDGARSPLAALAADGVVLPSVSLGCTVIAGARRLRLPLGALVGESQSVLAGETIPVGERSVQFPRDGDALLRSASRWFEGTPYQWGGLTPWGADCSGFVQSVFALHGVDLPRDAWQQARVGDAVDSDPAATVPGDLLFFSEREDRRITHVGVAAGEGRMAHLALGRGGWAVDDLAEPGDDYAAALRQRLVEVRRVL